MKTIIFLGSDDFGEKNNARQLASEFGMSASGNYKVVYIAWEDLLFHISLGKRSVTGGDVDLKNADLVIAVNWYQNKLRDVAYTVALYLKEHNVPVWNSELLSQRSTTKLSAMMQLAQANIDIPDSYFSLNHQLLESAVPFNNLIVKNIAASRGRDNYLSKSAKEMASILEKNPTSRYLAQRVIENDYDVRVICFNSEPKLAIKRQRRDKQSHLNNTSQGGEADLLPLEALPGEVLDEARKICRLFGREMAGIDYVVAKESPERYICLEVNAVPQLTSGSFTSEKYRALNQSIASLFGE